VVGLGDEHGGFHAVGETAEVPVCLQGAAERAEAVDEILDIDVEVRGFDFKPGEKFPAELIGKLGEFDEIAAMAGDVVGDLGDDAGLVATAEFED
jgi:hypothetical protein